MPFNRTSSRMAIGLLAILLTSPALGQGPLGCQLFAPADVSTYGGTQQPNEGYFFQFDGLYWAISSPNARYIGQDPNFVDGSATNTRFVWYGPNTTNAREQWSTATTGQFKDEFSPGQRYEFGRVEDRNGWFVSIYRLHKQYQSFQIDEADVLFSEPPATEGHYLLDGPVSSTDSTLHRLPTTLYNTEVRNSVSTWGVELMYLHRAMTCHSGGTFEFFAGARYLEFNDTFGVNVGDSPSNITSGDIFDGSSWENVAENHIVGPELGIKWSKKQGRWTLCAEGRFLAGLNCQNIHQTANLAPELDASSGALFMPTAWSGTTTSISAYEREWSPCIELRLEGRYQITRAISFHAGWSGLWLDGIARGNALVDYEVPSMGLNMNENRQDVFMNGLTLGFDVNR